jgi:hypothetical protein
MTLILMFEKAPVIVGDLMVSTEDDTRPIKVFNKDGTTAYSHYPMQKIISVHPGVHIACAGNVGDIRKIINFALGLRWPRIPSRGFTPAEVEKRLRPFLDKIGRYYDSRKLGVVGPGRKYPLQLIFFSNGLRFSVYADRLNTPAGPVHVIGSGVNDFKRYLQGPFNYNNKWAFPEQQCISLTLSFFAQVLTQRAYIRDRWGWGMEMLLFGKKKDSILLQAYQWEEPETGSEPQFKEIGDKIFSYYQHDFLHVLKQRADGQWLIRRAGPLTDDGGRPFTPAPADVPSSPQMVCTVFINKSDNSVHVYTENEPDDGVCSISLTGSGSAPITYPIEQVAKRFAFMRDRSVWHNDLGVPIPKVAGS